MSNPRSELTPTEVAEKGDVLFEQVVRPRLEKSDEGRIVAIDVMSGNYSIGESVLDAAKDLMSRCPSPEIWSVRIGHRGLRTFLALS